MAITIFHDMIHKEVEVYVDDMMVKSETREGHPIALENFLRRVKNTVSSLIPRNAYSE